MGIESRSAYHIFGEQGVKPYGWCVKLMIDGCDRGIVGFGQKKDAQNWLKWALNHYKNITEYDVYFASKKNADVSLV